MGMADAQDFDTGASNAVQDYVRAKS